MEIVNSNLYIYQEQNEKENSVDCNCFCNLLTTIYLNNVKFINNKEFLISNRVNYSFDVCMHSILVEISETFNAKTSYGFLFDTDHEKIMPMKESKTLIRIFLTT